MLKTKQQCSFCGREDLPLMRGPRNLFICAECLYQGDTYMQNTYGELYVDDDIVGEPQSKQNKKSSSKQNNKESITDLPNHKISRLIWTNMSSDRTKPKNTSALPFITTISVLLLPKGTPFRPWLNNTKMSR